MEVFLEQLQPDIERIWLPAAPSELDLVFNQTKDNSVLPEVGILTFHAEDGFMAGLGVSGHKSGIYAGILGGEILRVISPGDIPITDSEVTDTAFNLERAAILETELPIEELAIAEVVFQTIGSSRY